MSIENTYQSWQVGSHKKISQVSFLFSCEGAFKL